VLATTSGNTKKQLPLGLVVKPALSGAESSLDLILKYVKKSEILIER